MMNIKERNELAADIARRVRTFTWQPMPEHVPELLGNVSWNFQTQLWGPRVPALLLFDWYPQYKRLQMVFRLGDGQQVGRFLWTPDGPVSE